MNQGSKDEEYRLPQGPWNGVNLQALQNPVAGIDGASGHWVCVLLLPQLGGAPSLLEAATLAAFTPWLRHHRVSCVAVDVPLRLPPRSVRSADVDAQRLLGKLPPNVPPQPVQLLPNGRWPSNAPSPWICPPYNVIAAAEQAAIAGSNRTQRSQLFSQSLAKSYQVGDIWNPLTWSKGIGRQVCEAAAWLASPLPFTVIEVFPELTFWRINNRTPVVGGKQTWNGQQQRLTLLSGAGVNLNNARVTPLSNKAGAASKAVAKADDVIDAASGAVTAAMHQLGSTFRCPQKGTSAIIY